MKAIAGEVVSRAQQGERAAQRELYDQYADAIFGYVLNLAGAREEAVELAQEIWLRVFRRLPTLRDPQAFHAWLFQIAANIVRDHLKRAKPPPTVSLNHPDGDDEDDERLPEVANASGDPAKAAARHELEQRIQEALMRLPPERREVVILHHLEGFGVREIADQLGISVGTVKSRLGRGRARMRQLLADLIQAA